MLNAIEKVLSEGERRPKDTYRHLNVRKLDQKRVELLDPELRSFINLNTLKNLEYASDLDSPDL